MLNRRALPHQRSRSASETNGDDQSRPRCDCLCRRGLLLRGADDNGPRAVRVFGLVEQQPQEPFVDEVVDIGRGRGLYVRCTGEGSPTVVMEGGDLDTSSTYSFATAAVSEVTRACVYDRANLGRSDPASGPRGLQGLVGDLEAMLEAAEIPGPYVLVGTSGGDRWWWTPVTR